MEVDQDTLVALKDSLSYLSTINDAQIIGSDTLHVKEVDSGSLFNQITTLVTVIAATATAYLAFKSFNLNIKNKKIERKSYYYNQLVVEPCIEIIDGYSKEFRKLVEKIEKENGTGIDILIERHLIPEWDNLHHSNYKDLVSITQKWNKEPILSQKVSKICIDLEEELADEFKKIESSKNFDGEFLLTILNSSMSDIILKIQEFDPLFRNSDIKIPKNT